jgi:putative endonuclease
VAQQPIIVLTLDAIETFLHDSVMHGGWVYIVTDRPQGTLYIGVTSDIARRAWEHRDGVVQGFTKGYGLKRLVYTERYEDIRTATSARRR